MLGVMTYEEKTEIFFFFYSGCLKDLISLSFLQSMTSGLG